VEIGQLINIYERWKFLCVTLYMFGQEGKKEERPPTPTKSPTESSAPPTQPAGDLTVLFV
jgi:hypothetical protein